MGVWGNIWRSEAKDWLFGQLIDEHADGYLVSNKCYLSVMARSLRIVSSRIGFNRFYGAVQSYSRLPSMSGKYVEFTAITTPSSLRDVAKKDLGNFALGAHRLLGPVPYMGGDLELEIGLFAIKSQDMIRPFLEILEEISKAAGVGAFSVASPFIGPLKKGLDLLTQGSVDCELEIGLAATFDRPAPGRYFVARLDRKLHDAIEYSIDSQYRLITQDGSPVVDVPYLVFSIHCDPVRDDWFMIPEVSVAYQGLNQAVKEGQSFKSITSHKEHFRRILFASPDILPDHAEQIARWVADRINLAVGSEKTSATGKHPSLPPLQVFALPALY